MGHGNQLCHLVALALTRAPVYTAMTDLAVQRGIAPTGQSIQRLVSQARLQAVGNGEHRFGSSFAAGYIHTPRKQVKIRAELLPL